MPYKNSKITAKAFLSTGLVMMGLSAFSAANALTPPQVTVREIPFSFPKLPAEFNNVAQITDCGIWQRKDVKTTQETDVFYCSFNDQSNKKSTLWLRELNYSGLFGVEKTELLRLLPAPLTNGQFADIASDHQALMISAETYVPYGIKDKGGKEWAMDWSTGQQKTGLEFVLQAAYVPSDGIVGGLFLSLDDIVALGDEGQLVRFNPSQNKPQWTLTLSYQANEQQMESMAQGDAQLEAVYQIQTQQPSLRVSAAGEILVHKISWQLEFGRGGKTTGNMGTGVWCVSADGKLKGEHFFADHFFDESAMTALPQGGYVIWERIFRETSTVTLNEFSFNLITLDQNCQVTTENKGSLPPVYIENVRDGWIEDMQIQLTPAGDVLLIYTEHATSDEMTAPQLNAALIAQDGEVKWTQPVVAADNPYAWYLVTRWEAGNIQLKINVSFAPEGQSALISIFNPAPLRAESMNWLKPLPIRNRGVDNLLPKIYQLNWAK